MSTVPFSATWFGKSFSYSRSDKISTQRVTCFHMSKMDLWCKCGKKTPKGLSSWCGQHRGRKQTQRMKEEEDKRKKTYWLRAKGSEWEKGKSPLALVMTLHYNNGHLVCVFEKDVCISAYASASVCVCMCVWGVSKIRTVLNSFGWTKNSHEVQLPRRPSEDTNELCVCERQMSMRVIRCVYIVVCGYIVRGVTF